jgi:hypothetical protein
MQIIRLFSWLLIFYFLPGRLSAQNNNYLTKGVTLNAENIDFKEMLNAINSQTGVQFAYVNFNNQQKVTYACNNKELKLVLNDLLTQVNASFKQNDKYIIIKGNAKKQFQELLYSSPLSGYVYDGETTHPLANVSVFNRFNKEAVYTDENGGFKLNNYERFNPYPISIAKENFVDTSFLVYNPGEKSLTIYLHAYKKTQVGNQIPDSLNTYPALVQTDSTEKNPFAFFTNYWNRKKQKNQNFKNIKDTLYSEFNVSLIPYVSTNHLLAINTINNYSFNILGGYSKGVGSVELGGLFNYDAGNVRYLQIAGLANIVEGKSEGTQIAGLFNFNNSLTKAVQIGGFFNVDLGDFENIQIAGVGNWVSGDVKGVQIGGLINHNRKTITGVQISTLYNYAPNIIGSQISLVNKTKRLKGVQVGLINLSDTCEGLPIGFFSYVKKAYHKLELAIDENFLATISFRTGMERFHNIFILGTQIAQNNSVSTFGYGLGTLFDNHQKWHYGFDFTTQQLVGKNSEAEALNLLNKFTPYAVFSAHPKFQMIAGCSVNLSLFDKTSITYVTHFDNYPPSYFYNNNFGNFNVKGWIGFKIGARFL